MKADDEIRSLLRRYDGHDRAIMRRLTELLLSDLRRIASNLLKGRKRGSFLQTTVLINDAILNVFGKNHLLPTEKIKLLAYFRTAMKNVVFTYWRREKRGQSAVFQVSDKDLQEIIASNGKHEDKLDLEEALEHLAHEHPFEYEVFMLHKFLEMTLQDIAVKHGTSIWAVRKAWEFARSFLWQRLYGGEEA
ncbi:MAG: ECF-type sigma factor [Phycisphaerales bacterium]|nr:ECF-type sigma factor [Phycisphaerales bacterium]